MKGSLNKQNEQRKTIETTRLLNDADIEASFFDLSLISKEPNFLSGEKSKNFARLCSFNFKKPVHGLSNRLIDLMKPATTQELELLKDYISGRFCRELEMVENTEDNRPLLELRKALLRIAYSVREVCVRLVSSFWFELAVLIVILMNTAFLAMEDKDGNPPSSVSIFEDFFLFFYTGECAIKVLAFGLLADKDSYLRSYWNILDFFIVLSGWADRETSKTLNVSSLRVFRILRPLRGISSISGMKVMFLSIVKSIKPFMSALVILFFFVLVFAIAALQLWSGTLKYNCLNIDTGYIIANNPCLAGSCPIGYKCVKGLDNPNYGTTNFDNIFISFILVYQIITLEGWTEIMQWTQEGFSYYSIIFYIPVVFIGSTVVMNLALAIITSSFFEVTEDIREKKDSLNLSKEIEENISTFTSKVKTKEMSGNDEYILNTERDFFHIERKNKQDIFKGAWPTKSQSLCEKESETLIFLSRLVKIKSVLNIRRELTSIRTQKIRNISDLRLEISKDFKLESGSRNDVVPAERCISVNFSRKFSYSLEADSEKIDLKEKSDFPTFKKLVKLRDNQKAFYMLKTYAREQVNILSNEETATRVIVGQYSGPEVSQAKGQISTILSLNFMRFRIWSSGLQGLWERFRYPINFIITHRYTSFIMMTLVLLNTACLASDHYGISQAHSFILQTINNILTYIFAVEIFLRVIALGPYEFSRDKMNYFDFVVVVISVIEIAVSNNQTSAVSAFRAIRIFRIFRVLRVIRVFRYLNSMSFILKAINQSISSFFYFFLLLAIFSVVFALIGMTMFAGEFSFPVKPRSNFDDFHSAFVSTFIILSTENWDEILGSSIRSNLGTASSLFLITWIFIGNYVLLNLFLAILLESFNSDLNDRQLSEEDDLIREKNILDKVNKKTKKRLKIISDYKDSDSDNEKYGTELIDFKRDQSIWAELGENKCDKSFYIFGKSNKLRKASFKLIKSKKFEIVILIIILLNAIKLVIDTYYIDYPESSPQIQLSNIFDYIFTGLFFAEFLLKTVAQGFFYNKGTYLKDNWNKLDFVILLLSIIDFCISQISLPVIKVFRLLRALRPLRLINQNISMKIVVVALIESLSAIFNVIAVIFIIWLIYAILGVSLLNGKLYSCSNKSILSQDLCISAGNSWVNSYMNFDDVIQGMITLFVIMSQESWPNRMYEGIDARDQGLSPVLNYNPYMAYFYIGYVIIGNFFMLNLFTAVVFNKFNEAKTNESSVSSLILSKNQKLWTDIQRFVAEAEPQIEKNREPTGKISKFCYILTRSKGFEIGVVVLILGNILVLSMLYDQASDSYKEALDNANTALTFCFILEMVLKVVGLGVRGYLSRGWNKVDFIINMASIVDLVFELFLFTSMPLLRTIPQLIRVIRVLRVLRLFRLAKNMKSFQMLIKIIVYAFPAILNVLSLLTLMFFIYSILGVFLFHSVPSTGEINYYNNFSNFSSGMTILWRISTGEDYPVLMYQFSDSLGSRFYLIYFLFFVAVINFVIIELFVSVIIQNYEEYHLNDDLPLKQFKKDIKLFRQIWRKYTEDLNGIRISREFIEKFIIEFCTAYELINPDMQTPESLKKFSINLAISLSYDSKGYFYYNDVLFEVMKRKYDKKFHRVKSEFTKKILKIEEKKTLKRLTRIRKMYMKKFDTKPEVKHNEHFFLDMMYTKRVFKHWNLYTKREKDKMSITPEQSVIEYPGSNTIMDFYLDN